jgi:hypothetical protein
VTGRNTYVVFGSRPIGGLAALSGAVLFTIFDVLSILLFAKKENLRVIAATGSYALFVGLSLLTLVLIQVGLVGLYVPHSGATGILGLVGFLVTFWAWPWRRALTGPRGSSRRRRHRRLPSSSMPSQRG